MSHPTQFRVYFPKSGSHFYTTGFENGKPVVLVPDADKNERFQAIFDASLAERMGNPIIQRATGMRDKNNTMIFVGDMIFWHKFNWLGVVVEKPFDSVVNHNIAFWCQMQNGICSLIGSNAVSEVLFGTGLKDYEKIQQFLMNGQDILKQNGIQATIAAA